MANEITIRISAKDEASATLHGVRETANGLGSTLRRVGEIAGGFLAANVISRGVQSFTGFLGGSTRAASDLGESLNAVNVIFGESSQVVLDWGRNNATQFGLSQRAFNQLATPLGAMLKNSGMSMDQVADTTIRLTKRASDMASVFNTDVDQALGAIQAALRGEIDPIERFGVSMNAVRIEARALADTGKTSAAALTDQEKAAARLALIFEQTAAVEGDFANTSDQLANSQRIAAARTEELQAKIGDKLLPVSLKMTEVKLALVSAIADKLVPAIDQAARWVGEVLVPAFQRFVEWVAPHVQDLMDHLQVQFARFQVFYAAEIEPALENIRRGVAGVVEWIREHWSQIEPIVRPIFEEVRNVVETAMGIIREVIEIALDIIQGDWSGAWHNVQDLVGVVWSGIQQTIEHTLQIIVGVLEGLKDILFHLAKEAFGAIADGLEAVKGALLDKARDIRDGLKHILDPRNWFSTPEEHYRELWGAAFEGIADEARAAIPALRAAMERVRGTVSSPFPAPTLSLQRIRELDFEALTQGIPNAPETMADVAAIQQSRELHGALIPSSPWAPVVNVFIGQRELTDVVVEATAAAQRQGRL